MNATALQVEYGYSVLEQRTFLLNAAGYNFSCSLQVDRINGSLLTELSKINAGDEIDVEVIFRDKNGNEIRIK